MSAVFAYLIAGACALVAGWLVPTLVMRALWPVVSVSAPAVRNYRGRAVPVGLGIAWAVWAVALLVVSTVLDVVGTLARIPASGRSVALFEGPLSLPLFAVPLMLVLTAVLLGLVDDVFGGSETKGFKGHLTELRAGRLTTGALKLFGIGGVAAVYGWRIADMSTYGSTGSFQKIVMWVLATLAIALTANLVNLTDLRPGRALKTYVLLVAFAAPVFVTAAVKGYAEQAAALAQIGAAEWGGVDSAVSILLMLLVLLGPVAAVWRLDLGEHGILGDAGSNAMGAIAGYLLASALSPPWLAGVVAVMLVLNLLSEHVSFSRIIDAVGPLRALDRLGTKSAGDGEPDAAQDEAPDEDVHEEGATR